MCQKCLNVPEDFECAGLYLNVPEVFECAGLYLNVPMLFECASLGEWAGLGKCAGCV
jgi:hypothetical protein